MRARTLGWPDVYTFTKAMGERAVEDLAHERGLRLSIVRPIDHRVGARAPLARLDRRLQDGRPDHPRLRHGPDPRVPGHPRGHRRPDPRGLRRERDPGGGRDPAAARRTRPLQRVERRPEPAALLRAVRVRPRVLRGASAARARPRRAQRADLGLPRQPKVEKMLRRAETFVDLAEKVVTHMPKSKTMRDAVNRVDRDKARVDFIERYSDLYGMYTETEVVYTDARVQSLWGSLSAGRPGALPVRRRRARLEVLPAGRALPGRDAEPARALAEGPREADGRRSGRATTPCWRCSTWRARSSPPTWSSPTCGRASPT